MTALGINFDTYFQTAPPTVIVTPDVPKFTVVAVNPAYLDATNSKLEDLIGRELLEAFPENPHDPLTGNVMSLYNSIVRAITTKQQDILPSQKYDIPVRGTDRFITRYWKATNSPIVNTTGEVAYIAHVVLDITSAVEATQKERFAFEVAEAKRIATIQMEERLRLAIDSANLGTWHIDVATRKLTASYRLKEFFGFYQDDDMEFTDALNQVREDYRDKVFDSLELAIIQSALFDMEFPIIGYRDDTLRWVRATGKLYEAETSQPANLSGTLMDITERKMNEIRKNDFIAMVSHELKTPLTSTKAYVQVLIKKAKNVHDDFATATLKKVHRQVEKCIHLLKAF